MPGFGDRQRAPQPPPVAVQASPFSSSAKLLEQTYILSAQRTAPRSRGSSSSGGSRPASATFASNGRPEWGAQRQKISRTEVEREVQERMRGMPSSSSSSNRRHNERWNMGGARGDEGAVDAVTQAAALMFASPGVNLHTSTAQPPSASSAPSAQPVPVEQSQSHQPPPPPAPSERDGDEGMEGEPVHKTVAEEADVLLASLGGDAIDGSSPAATAPYAEDLPPPTPTRAPGLAGELARAQALLRDAVEEQRRLEAALGAARDAAADAAAEGEARLDAERARHRRELHFVQSGIDAASAQREAAAAKRREGHERALKRAVREAEARVSAEAAAAAADAEEAHRAELDAQAMRYERQMGMQAAPVVELASRVRRLQTTGAWPAHAAPSSPAAHSAALFADADDEEQEYAMSMAGDGVLPRALRTAEGYPTAEAVAMAQEYMASALAVLEAAGAP